MISERSGNHRPNLLEACSVLEKIRLVRIDLILPTNGGHGMRRLVPPRSCYDVWPRHEDRLTSATSTTSERAALTCDAGC
jgi:hypothetical protein